MTDRVNRKWLLVSFSFVRGLACMAIGFATTGFWDLLGYRFLASLMNHGTTPAIASLTTSYFNEYGKMGYANSMISVATSIGGATSALSLLINLEVG
jgi:MFS family permease